MYKNRLCKYFITTLVFLTFSAVFIKHTQAEERAGLTIEELMKKAKKVHTLMKEKEAEGLDVSKALKLDQESKEAAEKGDLDLADKLLDDAIESLSGSPDKEKPEAASAEPVTSESLMKKAEKLHALVEEKKAKGLNISETLKLDQMSREAAEKGNFSLANKLLDDAIKSLTGLADKEKPGVGGKETVTPDKPAKKLETFHALIEERLDKGINVSEIFRLDQMSREAASKGDQALAIKLLDDAIKRMSAMTGNVKPAKKTVDISVNAEKVLVTEGVPKYERGEEVEDYKSAFDTKTVEAKDGIVKLEIGYVPVFIEEAENTSSSKTPMENSPFGFHPANTYSIVVDRNENNLVPPSKMGYTFHNALDIGVRWTRPEFYANWGVIQKTDRDLKEGIFDWTEYDYVYGKTPWEIGIVGNIGGFEFRTVKGKDPFPRTFQFQTKELEKKYVSFVQKLVERYDGDGVDDMPGLQNPIRYWQVDNEPDIGTRDWEGFAHLVEITAKAIKSACSGCKVIMGGLAQGETGFDMFFLPVLKKLNGQYVDIFDFHSYGPAGAWHYYKLADKIKTGLAKTGFKNTDIWILESGTYSGKPHVSISGGSKVPAQAEKQQAADLIKRYVYGSSVGIKKIFWAFGIVEGFTGKGDHEFDYMGLMYQRKPDNTGRMHEAKKLAYYAYKKMTEKLEGCDFSSIKSLNPGEGVYAFKLNRSGKSVYVVWAE